MTQSPAIIEWIEETWPHPPLLPRDAQGRAQVRAMAAIVGCDIHPLNNRRVLEMLRKRFGFDVVLARRDSDLYHRYIEFFSRVREMPHLRKGLLRLEL